MSYELSPPVRIAALLGSLVALLAGAFAIYSIALRPHQASETVKPTVTPIHAAASRGTVQVIHVPAHRVVVDPALPAPLRSALRAHRTVVTALWAPGIPADGPALKEARLGAAAAHLPFTVLNVTNEPVAAALAAWAPQAADPAVLVVERPGKIVAELDGWADRNMVQAAANGAR